MNRTLLVAICMIASAILLSCNSDQPLKPTAIPPANQPPDLSVTPMPNEEAEIAALVLSRELVAPKWLYNRIKTDLEVIRSTFQDSIPAVNIKFRSFFRPSSLGMQLDATVFFDTVSGGGRIFDSLNRVYRLDTCYRMFDDFYGLTFEGRLNSARLVDIYAGIPGEYIVWSPNSGPGDHPALLIWPEGLTFKYFFRDAWGDCPSGCMSSEIFYFTATGGTITFRESYLSDRSNSDPRPPWWDTALMAYDTIFYDNIWYADSNQVGP